VNKHTRTRAHVSTMFGTRNSGAAGTGGNDVPQVTQPTQAELDATALALANQQEMTRLRQLETEIVREAAAATLLAQQQLVLAQQAVPPAYQPVSFNRTLPGAPAKAPLQQHLVLLTRHRADKMPIICLPSSQTKEATSSNSMWIILIQSPEFARGKGELTAEFQEM